MPRNGNRPGGGAADSVSIDNAAEFTRRPANTQALPLDNIVVGQRHRDAAELRARLGRAAP
jgi:hypothetical protein